MLDIQKAATIIFYKLLFFANSVGLVMLEKLWQQFLSLVNQEMGSRVVETWFKAIVLQQWDDAHNTIYLEAPNVFIRDWVYNNYLALIELHFTRLLHIKTLKIVIIVQGDSNNILVVPAVALHEKAHSIAAVPKNNRYILQPSSIKDHYLFENFVVGPNNSLAYAAAQAVAQKPGVVYNPLFMYGNSGVGKTHLLHAIGNEIKKIHKNVVVLYQSADRFVTEFIQAIRFDKVHKFQAKYQSIDVLLVDDIQCIAHKEQTQEAFFYIFNILYDAHKQIVFSSDTYPQHMAGIAERLRSRLAMGLVTDLYFPSLETKVAILKKKAETAHNLVLADDVAYYIANGVISNVRDLEGALIRVVACALLTKQEITLALAQQVLAYNEQKRAQPANRVSTTFSIIIEALQKVFPYTLESLCGKSRNKDLVQVRHLAMYLIKKITNSSLREIGNFLGDRDHATVKHGIEKIENELTKNKQLLQQVKRIESALTI